VLVWRLDRWGRSLVDLVTTLKELSALGVAFVSLTEALDLTAPTGRAMAGLLSVFAGVRSANVSARASPRRRCRASIWAAADCWKKASQIRKLCRGGVSKAEIARRLSIGTHIGAA
jgi:putative DNA-invertase from lambdoid prophage Rac